MNKDQSAISIQVIMLMIRNMDKVLLLGKVEINILVAMLRICDMATEKCIGQTDQTTKETGIVECSMDLELLP